MYTIPRVIARCPRDRLLPDSVDRADGMEIRDGMIARETLYCDSGILPAD